VFYDDVLCFSEPSVYLLVQPLDFKATLIPLSD